MDTYTPFQANRSPLQLVQEEPSPSLTDALFHHTEAHQKNAQNDQQDKTTTQNRKNSKKTRRQLPVDFDSSSMSDSETSSDDFSPAEVIDSPPKTKRGSVRRQASIKASKSLGQVTKRKKKKLVTEVITPMDQ